MDAETAPRIGRLGPHIALLTIGLALAAWFVDVDRAVFDADEGALLMQIQVLSDHGGWFAPNPPVVIDPDTEFTAVVSALTRDGEIAPFPVRPAWVGITKAAWEIGGVRTATMLGITGVVAAAVFTALIAAMVERRATLPAFWLIGAASPLAFHALVLQGHGVVTGLGGFVMWVTTRSVACRTIPHPFLIVGTFAATFAGALIRREVLLFAVALAGVACLLPLRRRSWALAIVPTIAVVGALAGVVADRMAMAGILDTGGRSLPIASGQGSFLTQRFFSAATFVRPGYEVDSSTARILILTAAIMAIFTAVRYLRVRDERELVIGTSLTALILALRLLVAGDAVVQGIVTAFPLGVAGFILGFRGRRGDDLMRVLIDTALLFALMTALTQYPSGGGFEWGSRYLSIGLVAAVPVAAVGLARTWNTLADSSLRRVLLAATVATALLPTAMGYVAQRAARSNNAENLAAGHTLAHSLDTDLIISTHAEIPRVATDQLTSGDLWFWAWPHELEELLELLEDSGRDRAALFTRQLELTQEFLEGTGWEYRDVEIRPDNPGTVALGVLVKVDAG